MSATISLLQKSNWKELQTCVQAVEELNTLKLFSCTKSHALLFDRVGA